MIFAYAVLPILSRRGQNQRDCRTKIQPALDVNAVSVTVTELDTVENIIQPDAFGRFLWMMPHILLHLVDFFHSHAAAVVKNNNMQFVPACADVNNNAAIFFYIFQPVQNGIFHNRLQQQRKDGIFIQFNGCLLYTSPSPRDS